MLRENKFSAMVEILLLLQVLLFQGEILVHGSIRNDKPGISSLDHQEVMKEHSSNQLPVKEGGGKEKPENDQQLYYLPTRTISGESNIIQTGHSGLSTTSPPSINIDPAPRQTHSYAESTGVLDEEHHPSKEGSLYKDPYQCVSETPAILQLESHLLLPSSNLIQQSVIMSGHLEIVSKTSTVEEASREADPVVASRPSVAVVQGTSTLESHTIRDL